MPGFDRTGPVGYGPRTGRGLGDCYGASGRRFFRNRRRMEERFRAGARGMGRRFRGRQFGGGMGPGPAPWAYDDGPEYYGGYGEEMSPEEEKEMELKDLKEEAEYLEKELGYIRKQMEELESSSSKDED